jgi:hypothetical protein
MIETHNLHSEQSEADRLAYAKNLQDKIESTETSTNAMREQIGEINQEIESISPFVDQMKELFDDLGLDIGIR